MKRLLTLCALAGLAFGLQAQAANFSLRLAHGNAREQAARAQFERVLAELKTMYPNLPVGYPEGADSADSSYSHLLVICIELDGVRKLLGEGEEKRILAFWQDDHYRTLYRIVAADRERIRGILDKHALQLPHAHAG